jgi:two-component system response regulator FixJ
MERTILHIVCDDSRSRAEQARIAFALGHHSEVYAELDELYERPPAEGIVLAADNGRAGMVSEILMQLADRGIWLPLVVTAPEPDTEQVVAAIKAGALDYLRLPLEMGYLARHLQAIVAEAGHLSERRLREVFARQAVALLSGREREVLELLSSGCSNKEIARALAISPRTVEIHRGNMMTKLGAGHAADAIRLWIDAQLEPSGLLAEDWRRGRDTLGGIAGRIGPRRPIEAARALRQRQ